FVSIGTSSVVYPAAGLIDLAKQQGSTVIEINPNPTQTPEVDIVLQGKAGVILPLLVNALK
ncbi:MAG: NAD-dependent protein deacylase, partial [Moraxella osloensis]|nr:NAD-dependent protein deacylase [Moraxella osloensis]